MVSDTSPLSIPEAANTLAYYDTTTNIAVKKFYSIGPLDCTPFNKIGSVQEKNTNIYDRALKLGRHDIQQNDTQQNDTQQNSI